MASNLCNQIFKAVDVCRDEPGQSSAVFCLDFVYVFQNVARG